MPDRWTQSRIAGALFVAQGLFSAAVITAFTLSTIIAADLGGSDIYAGVPTTMTLLGRAAAAFPAGWLMDRIGRRNSLSGGFLLGALGGIIALAAVVAGSLPILLLGTLLLGMGRGAGEQGRYVAAEVFTPAKRSRVLGIIVFAGTAGAIGGPLLVAPSVRWAERQGLPGYGGPYVAAGLLMLLAVVVVWLFLRPDPLELSRLVEAALPQRENSIALHRSLRKVAADGRVRLALLTLLTGQLVMTMLMVLTPLHMSYQGHGEGRISAIIMAHTLGMYGLSWFTGWLNEKIGQHATIAGGALLLLAAAVLAPLATTVLVLGIALFLLGLGWNFCVVAGSALLVSAVEAGERGRVQGASETFVALAAGAGSLTAGPLFRSAGMFLPATVGIAFALTLLGALLLFRRMRPAVPAAAEGTLVR